MKIIEGKDSQQLDVRIRFDSLEENRQLSACWQLCIKS